MAKYKVKYILDNHLIIEYRTENGSLKELQIFVEPDWSKEKIEEEIAKQKILQEKRDVKINISQYFSKGEELEFINYISEEEKIKESEELFYKEQEELRKQADQELLNKIIEYRSTPVDYKDIRSHLYPDIYDQIDALYWMRRGVMEPIEELDKKITEVKENYPKNTDVKLTLGDLDDMFPNLRPTGYKDDLRARNLKADFL